VNASIAETYPISLNVCECQYSRNISKKSQCVWMPV